MRMQYAHAVCACSTHPSRRAELLVKKTSWNHELPGAVDKPLEVLEVTRQSHVTEDCLLEFAVQSVKNAVDTYARLLLLDRPVSRL